MLREEADKRAACRREQLESLKQRIRELPSHPPLIDGYPCQWDGATNRVRGFVAFGNWVSKELERAILYAPELQEHFKSAALARFVSDLADTGAMFTDFNQLINRFILHFKPLKQHGATAQSDDWTDA